MGVFGASRSEKRLKELESEMLKLTRIVESRDLDWQDMRARCKRLLDRAEKAQRAVEHTVESDEVENPAIPDGGEAPKSSFTLTPSQVRLQQQILKMRRSA